jgi:hypothetical protein
LPRERLVGPSSLGHATIPGGTRSRTRDDIRGQAWRARGAWPHLTLSLAANTLFDAVARRSTSLLKDYAPLAGRDVRLTLNLKV